MSDPKQYRVFFDESYGPALDAVNYPLSSSRAVSLTDAEARLVERYKRLAKKYHALCESKSDEAGFK